jgi:predicted RNA-binding Zn-ribbon protein involved in translation (DUF1610 family)
MLGRDGRRLFDGTPDGSPRDGSGLGSARRPEAASTLLATCPDCGDVVVDICDTVVRGSHQVRCWYSFRCPSCGHLVDVAAPTHLARVLLCLGAVEEAGGTGAGYPLTAPERAADRAPDRAPDRVPDGPLTADEVIDLALSLRAVTDVTAFQS